MKLKTTLALILFATSTNVFAASNLPKIKRGDTCIIVDQHQGVDTFPLGIEVTIIEEVVINGAICYWVKKHKTMRRGILVSSSILAHVIN